MNKNDSAKYINVFYPFDGKSGIGDFVICAGLCPELAIKYKRVVRFICHESLKRFHFEYENTEMVYLSDKEFQEKKENVCKKPNQIYAWFQKNEEGKIIRGYDVNFADEFKKYVFDLPLQCRVNPPKIDFERIKNELQDGKIKRTKWDKAIVLAPYSSSANKLQNELLDCGWWEKVARILKHEYGYNIYTNIKNDKERPIKGTSSLEICGDELIYVAKECKAFIGIRMGLMDLLSIIGAKVICVANMGYFHYDLKMMYPDANVVSCYMCWRFLEEINKRVSLNEQELLIINALNIQLKYSIGSSNNIEGQRYCLSYEKLLNTVMEYI